MLKVDDRFKSWMRCRMKDRDYADRIIHELVDYEDCTLLKVHPHAALPIKIDDDPEAMIGLIKGHDNGKDEDFLLAIFGDWEDFKDLSKSYIGQMWEMYHPVSRRDFENLPHIYEVAFVESDSDEAIITKRWNLTVENDGAIISRSEYEDLKINLINTRMDSDIIRIITGGERKDGQLDTPT